nr:proline-rich receptor-like protein kinase PERK3 [Ipomoea batatas]
MEGGQMQKVMVIHDGQTMCWMANKIGLLMRVYFKALGMSLYFSELFTISMILHLDFLAAAKQRICYEEEEMDSSGIKEQNWPCTYAEMLALSKQCPSFTDVTCWSSRKSLAVESAKELEAYFGNFRLGDEEREEDFMKKFKNAAI